MKTKSVGPRRSISLHGRPSYRVHCPPGREFQTLRRLGAAPDSRATLGDGQTAREVDFFGEAVRRGSRTDSLQAICFQQVATVDRQRYTPATSPGTKTLAGEVLGETNSNSAGLAGNRSGNQSLMSSLCSAMPIRAAAKRRRRMKKPIRHQATPTLVAQGPGRSQKGTRGG